MSEREGANVYDDFKTYLYNRIVYDKDTEYPVTYRQITSKFPLSKECSAQIVTTLIEEANGGEAVFTLLETGAILPCYRNLRLRKV